jgi:hypothetical protein
MGIFDFLFGKESKIKKLPTMSDQQGELFKSLLGSLQGGNNQAMNLLQQYLNPQSDIYQNFEKPYLQQFEQETVPMLAERFAGAGAQGGALSSSGFGQALSSAGSNLQTGLAQMKSGMQRQSIQDILGMNQMALGTSPFSYLQKPASAGFLPQLMAAMLKTGAGGM